MHFSKILIIFVLMMARENSLHAAAKAPTVTSGSAASKYKHETSPLSGTGKASSRSGHTLMVQVKHRGEPHAVATASLAAPAVFTASAPLSPPTTERQSPRKLSGGPVAPQSQNGGALGLAPQNTPMHSNASEPSHSGNVGGNGAASPRSNSKSSVANDQIVEKQTQELIEAQRNKIKQTLIQKYRQPAQLIALKAAWNVQNQRKAALNNAQIGLEVFLFNAMHVEAAEMLQRAVIAPDKNLDHYLKGVADTLAVTETAKPDDDKCCSWCCWPSCNCC